MGNVHAGRSPACCFRPLPDWLSRRTGRSGVDRIAISSPTRKDWLRRGPAPVLVGFGVVHWARGYSSIAVVSGTLYTMYRRGDRDVVIALEAESGKDPVGAGIRGAFLSSWVGRRRSSKSIISKGDSDLHSTPLIVGNYLFAAGATGWFHCLDKNTGEVIWEHHLFADLGGFVRQRGYAPSPIQYKDTVILPVGAAGGSIMAFNQEGREDCPGKDMITIMPMPRRR